MKNVKICNKIVSEKSPCFIIAEAGVNHNGDVEIAKKLVDAAKKAGADAIKFQTFKAEGLVTKFANLVDYQIKNVKERKSQLDMLKNLELKYEDFKVIKKYCDQKDIIFLSTPHSFDAIDFLENLVPAYKFGSGDITNIPALKYAAKKEKPMIIGTGMSNLKEVRCAVDTIKSEGNKQIIILHCTTNYPCPIEEVNLRAMITMRQKIGCLVGYSDHTLGVLVPVVAVAIGACIIEKHFTLDKDLPGPDHKASIEPSELQEMIKSIRNVEKILGSKIKKPTKDEEKIKNYVRKSLIAKMDIPKGKVITKNMLDIKRPGNGIKPKYFSKLLGKKARYYIEKDEILTWKMIE